MSTTQANKKLTFEQALQQLETIADQIEKGDVSLEDSVAKYEQGMGLVKHCRAVLSKAELRIQKLQEREDGSLTTRPMKKPAD